MKKLIKVLWIIVATLLSLLIFVACVSGGGDSTEEVSTSTLSDQEQKLIGYISKFEEEDSNLEGVKDILIENAYQNCDQLDLGTEGYAYNKNDPYEILLSLETSPRWFALTSGSVIYMCPQHTDGMNKFLDSLDESAIRKYLIDSYKFDEGYTQQDRDDALVSIAKNLVIAENLYNK